MQGSTTVLGKAIENLFLKCLDQKMRHISRQDLLYVLNISKKLDNWPDLKNLALEGFSVRTLDDHSLPDIVKLF